MIFFFLQLCLSAVATTYFATIFAVIDFFMPGAYFVSLPLSILVFFTTAIPVLAAINRTTRTSIKGRIGRYPQKETAIWAISSTTCDIAFTMTSKFTFRNSFPVGIYRLFGLKTGPGTVISAEIWDPDFIELGSGVRIGEETAISAHTIEYGVLSRGKITIGNNCYLGDFSATWPGTSICSNSYFRAHSIVPRNRSINEEGIYEGMPVKLVQKRSQLFL